MRWRSPPLDPASHDYRFERAAEARNRNNVAPLLRGALRADNLDRVLGAFVGRGSMEVEDGNDKPRGEAVVSVGCKLHSSCRDRSKRRRELSERLQRPVGVVW